MPSHSRPSAPSARSLVANRSSGLNRQRSPSKVPTPSAVATNTSPPLVTATAFSSSESSCMLSFHTVTCSPCMRTAPCRLAIHTSVSPRNATSTIVVGTGSTPSLRSLGSPEAWWYATAPVVGSTIAMPHGRRSPSSR